MSRSTVFPKNCPKKAKFSKKVLQKFAAAKNRLPRAPAYSISQALQPGLAPEVNGAQPPPHPPPPKKKRKREKNFEKRELTFSSIQIKRYRTTLNPVRRNPKALNYVILLVDGSSNHNISRLSFHTVVSCVLVK